MGANGWQRRALGAQEAIASGELAKAALFVVLRDVADVKRRDWLAARRIAA
jgi:hypothetical protein